MKNQKRKREDEVVMISFTFRDGEIAEVPIYHGKANKNYRVNLLKLIEKDLE